MRILSMILLVKPEAIKTPDSLSEKQKKILEESEWKLNKVVGYLHDDIVLGLKKITRSNTLEAIVSNLFIKAVGSGISKRHPANFSVTILPKTCPIIASVFFREKGLKKIAFAKYVAFLKRYGKMIAKFYIIYTLDIVDWEDMLNYYLI